MKKTIVLKFGSATITNNNGQVDTETIKNIAAQIATLIEKYNIVIVSSGAVAAGKLFIKDYNGLISERKAAAAIGNPLLMSIYQNAFLPHNIIIAQSLCERSHFANRKQFLQLKDTYNTLWKSAVIPIANENDVVSDLELKFSDNDELATLLALAFDAEVLMIGSGVDGLLDKNGVVVSQVKEVDEHVFGLVNKEKSITGLGGMQSKLTFAKLASKLGIKVILFGAKNKNALLYALEGKSGTSFIPQKSTANARLKWLAGGALVSGRIYIDDGAKTALLKRKSLLLVGVTHFTGTFEKHEIVEISDTNHEIIALAKIKKSSIEMNVVIDKKGIEIANADDILII
jgi:glutamate 5-kinase